MKFLNTAVFVIFCLASESYAGPLGELSISAVRSQHTESSSYSSGSSYDPENPYQSGKLNERHLMVSYIPHKTNLIMAYIDKNSYGDPVFYVGGVKRSPTSTFGINIEATGGLVFGYEDDQLRHIVGKASFYGWLGVRYTPPKQKLLSFSLRGIPGVYTISVDLTFK